MDVEVEREILARVADRYTAAELVELLDIKIEDILEEHRETVLANLDVLDIVEEVGEDDEEDVGC